MLVDSHCHLDFPGLQEDLDGVMTRAAAAGIATMVTICTRVDRFADILAIAERFDNVFCSVGLHPHDAESEPDLTTARLVELAAHDKVIGIGETGLDFHYDHSPRALQAELFRRHIAAARQTGLPLIVHSRAADDEMIAILRDETAKGPFPGVLHCFSSGPELAQAALALDFYISFSGIVTFNKADEVRAVAAATPLDRLLVETDAPYLAPVPHRGKTNEPAFVANTAAKLAGLHGVSSAEIAALTSANFYRLFTKAPGPASVTAAGQPCG
ncbi:MAG: TatD family hydrolase [Proteobacteria bacterium]|nr:TatD family hydrolase [Pseudomonadota bacterium]